ncbi:MAG: thioredoxin domain-containing protein [Pseudomonadota bacterium]
MKKVLFIILTAIAVTVLYSGPVFARIEWRILNGIQLDDTPVDTAVSYDGTTVYVLCSESINVYSMPLMELVESIPLQSHFSQISIGPDDKTLFLTDEAGKRVSVVEVTPVFDINIGHSQVIGKADAKVRIVLFSDYECPYCSRIYPVLEQLLKKYPDQVNLVSKHYPLRSHKFAKPAAVAAIAAARQGKYPEMSKALYKEYNQLSDEKIKEVAKNVGLDMERFENDIKDPLIFSQIDSDVQLAKTMKIIGIPTIYINGRAVKTNSVQDMSQMIEKELNKN